jgi:hypothetical protein
MFFNSAEGRFRNNEFSIIFSLGLSILCLYAQTFDSHMSCSVYSQPATKIIHSEQVLYDANAASVAISTGELEIIRGD